MPVHTAKHTSSVLPITLEAALRLWAFSAAATSQGRQRPSTCRPSSTIHVSCDGKYQTEESVKSGQPAESSLQLNEDNTTLHCVKHHYQY